MSQRVIRTILAIGLLLPVSGLAQETSKQGPAHAAETTLTTALVSQVSARDTQFLALIHARDGQWAILQELRRIVSFNDNFRSQIQNVLTRRPSSYLSPLT